MDQPEEYVLLSSHCDEKSASEASDGDRRLKVHRTRIDFNRKSCKLITFTDISVVKKLKSWKKTNQVHEMQKYFL